MLPSPRPAHFQRLQKLQHVDDDDDDDDDRAPWGCPVRTGHARATTSGRPHPHRATKTGSFTPPFSSWQEFPLEAKSDVLRRAHAARAASQPPRASAPTPRLNSMLLLLTLSRLSRRRIEEPQLRVGAESGGRSALLVVVLLHEGGAGAPRSVRAVCPPPWSAAVLGATVAWRCSAPGRRTDAAARRCRGCWACRPTTRTACAPAARAAPRRP